MVANSIDESTFNQIASKRGAQSKILRLLDELAVHYQNLWGLGGHPRNYGPALCLAFSAQGAALAPLDGPTGPIFRKNPKIVGPKAES